MEDRFFSERYELILGMKSQGCHITSMPADSFTILFSRTVADPPQNHSSQSRHGVDFNVGTVTMIDHCGFPGSGDKNGN